MYINLYRIQSLFSGYKSRIIEKNGTEGDIYDVPCLTGFQILEKASLPLIPHYLYISRTFSTELLHYASVNDDICFLITVSDLPDRGDPAFDQLPPRFHLLFIENANCEMLLNTLQHFFCQTNGAGLFADSLLSILTKSSDINEMVKHASLTLRNPVMVFDGNLNLSAYYIHRTDFDNLHTIRDIVREGGLAS